MSKNIIIDLHPPFHKKSRRISLWFLPRLSMMVNDCVAPSSQMFRSGRYEICQPRCVLLIFLEAIRNLIVGIVGGRNFSHSISNKNFVRCPTTTTSGHLCLGDHHS